MLKKIRCFYWRMRDRGKGKQVILSGFLVVSGLVMLTGLTARNAVLSRVHRSEVHTETGTSTGTSVSVSGSSATGVSATAESGDSEEGREGEQVHTGADGDVPVEQEEDTPVEPATDTSGLDAFHGFMTDDAYAVMEEQVRAECRSRQCDSAKKLNYQQTSEGSFDVGSFILLSDGSILRCDYNLKSGAVSVSGTDYSEADITAMHEEELRAEQEALEKRQREDKKKAAKKSGKKAKTKKKGKAKKKITVRKSSKNKKAKSKSRKKSAKRK